MPRNVRRGEKKQGEDMRTVTYNSGEDQDERRKDARYEPSGWSRERSRERRETSPRAKRSLGGRFKRCQGFVVYQSLFILLGNGYVIEGFLWRRKLFKYFEG